MNKKHTPEPWVLINAQTFSAISDQENAGFVIGGCKGPESIENARRIVACVNACKGLTTEALLKMTEVKNNLLEKSVFMVEEIEDLREEVKQLREQPEPPWLEQLTSALGWQGGTIHQVIDAVKILKEREGRSS